MSKLKEIYRSVLFTNRFFYGLAGVVFLFVCIHFLSLPVAIGLLFLFTLLIFTGVDAFVLFKTNSIRVERSIPDKLSNGDENHIVLNIESTYDEAVSATIIDELPVQLQQRNFYIDTELLPGQMKAVTYQVSPVNRGVYEFNQLNVIVQTNRFNLVRRHYRFFGPKEATVYPSIIQMKKYEFLAISNQLQEYGIKKLRRIGQSQEFEQIREYVRGDDYRTINWKATSRKHELMVNEYIDEKSQRVYSIIDKGRVMKMPFNKMTLLDYSINAALAISNIVIKHQNKPGLVTYSREVDSFVPAEKSASQLNKILEVLYAQKTDFAESNYERLFFSIRKQIKTRSLLLFYTNFEHRNALYRQIKYFRSIAKKHVLVVIFFQNTELEEFTDRRARSTKEIYEKTIGKKYLYEKEFIVRELNKYGIHTILTKPDELTVNTINKYLELRSRGLIN